MARRSAQQPHIIHIYVAAEEAGRCHSVPRGPRGRDDVPTGREARARARRDFLEKKPEFPREFFYYGFQSGVITVKSVAAQSE
jgi:hypothetical protein